MIKDLRENMSVNASFLIKDCATLTSASGTTYLSMILQDSTGTIEAKKFDIHKKDYDIFQAGNFVEIDADTNVFKEKLQLIVHSASLLDPNKINIKYFVKSTNQTEAELKKETYDYIKSIKNKDLNKIVKTIIDQNWAKFVSYPAGVRVHHDFFGGLITHTLSMCKVADFLCKNIYKNLNRDLLLSGCMLHDIGKLVELSGTVGTVYTVEGRLVGHLVIGAMYVQNAAKELNLKSEEVTLLIHMLLSHHGKIEYGSPVLPMIKEAVVLNMIDDMDAKVNTMEKLLDNTTVGSYTDRIFTLDNRVIYKHSLDKKDNKE